MWALWVAASRRPAPGADVRDQPARWLRRKCARLRVLPLAVESLPGTNTHASTHIHTYTSCATRMDFSHTIVFAPVCAVCIFVYSWRWRSNSLWATCVRT